MLDKYKPILDVALKDREALLKKQADLADQRDLIDSDLEDVRSQLRELDDTIVSLARLCKVKIDPLPVGITIISRIGLTRAIRAIFRIGESKLTAIEVRDRLLEEGFDEAEYGNLLASIHSTLKRMNKTGELLKEDIDRKAAYFRNPDFIERAQMSMDHPASQEPGTIGRMMMGSRPTLSAKRPGFSVINEIISETAKKES